MKNRFLDFLRKYWLCFLLSIIMVIGIYLSTRYAHLYESGSVGDMIRFDLMELYLVIGLPIYSLIYGCIAYIKTRRILISQLILFGISFVYWFIYGLEALFWPGTYIWSVYPVIFSLIGTILTAFIYSIIKTVKENKN